MQGFSTVSRAWIELKALFKYMRQHDDTTNEDLPKAYHRFRKVGSHDTWNMTWIVDRVSFILGAVTLNLEKSSSEKKQNISGSAGSLSLFMSVFAFMKPFF